VPFNAWRNVVYRMQRLICTLLIAQIRERIHCTKVSQGIASVGLDVPWSHSDLRNERSLVTGVPNIVGESIVVRRLWGKVPLGEQAAQR
jgi:hypothetical protein